MRNRNKPRHNLFIALALCVGAGLSTARDPEASTPLGVPRADSAGDPRKLAPQELARRLDALMNEAWSRAEIKPAPDINDSRFLRRATCDLAGRIPTVGETRAFLDDTRDDKRQRLVAELLQKATFASHLANQFRAVLMPAAPNDPQARALSQPFEAWLRVRLAENTPYPVWVRELLTVRLPEEAAANPRTPTGPASFFLANERKPENLAGSVARAFLGVQVQCAQCHDHPSGDWKRTEFWQFAAFFNENTGNNALRGRIEIPGLKTTVDAHFLGGDQPRWQPNTSGRDLLADWLTNPRNPYFAKAIVNRVWSFFFGLGLVEPVDDLVKNPGSQPQVLEELTQQFVLHDGDLKYLCHALVLTRMYQLSSVMDQPSQSDPRHFASFMPRGMTPEQLLTTVAQATGLESLRNRRAEDRTRDPFSTTMASRFLGKFADSDPRQNHQASILQALTLMNGEIIAAATDPNEGGLLRAVADAPFLSDQERLETLFFATYNRPLTVEEEKELLPLVSAGLPTERRQALANIFWALLNSAEFVLIH